MIVKKHKVKSCCGHITFVFETDKPIKKPHLKTFREKGYIAPENFSNSGVFYVSSGGLVATTSFGATKINVKCHGAHCTQKLNEFEDILTKL